MRYLYLYAAAISIATTAAGFVYVFLPDYQEYLLSEDRFAENLSALTFFLAATIALTALIRFRKVQAWDTRVLWTIA